MPKSRIQEILPAIEASFTERSVRVFSAEQIEAIRAANQDDWGLPPSTVKTRFLNQLIAHTPLRRFELQFNGRRRIVYTWGEVPLLLCLSALWPTGYFSHGTASYLNGLEDDLPQNIFVNVEQRNASPEGTSLAQDRIDAAFRKQQRMPTQRGTSGAYEIFLTNGRNTGRRGVSHLQIEGTVTNKPYSLRTTSLERTLIDLAVRPAYVGGPKAVLSAFRRATARLDLPALANLLSDLSFIYPYRQAIGFYLEQTNTFSVAQLAPFKTPVFEHDFYLAHGMQSTRYIPTWRLHVPLDV